MEWACINCEEPVKLDVLSGYGSYYTHVDGYMECKPRYASPNFDRQIED